MIGTLVVGIALVAGVAFTRNPVAEKQRFYDKGLAYMKAGKPAAAAIEFSNAVRADPKFADAYYQLGRAQIALRQGRPAFESFTKATELKPTHTAAQVAIGELFLAAGDPVKARERANLALGQEPQNLHATLLLAYSYGRERSWDLATQTAQRAVSQHPQEVQAYLGLAAIYAAANNRADAERTYGEAVKANPNAPEAYLALARYHFQANRLSETEQVLVSAITALPKNLDLVLALGDFYSMTGRPDQAATTYARAAKVNPDDSRAPARLADILLARGKSSEVESLLAGLSERAGEGGTKQLIQGKLHLSRRQFVEAEKAFRAALAVAPSNAEAHFQLGRTLAFQGDLEGARVAFASAANFNPNSPLPQLALAEVYARLENLGQAERAVQQALAVDPRNIQALILYGDIQLAQRKPDAAAEQFARAATLLPGSPLPQYHLGRAHLAAKRESQAIAAFEAALSRQVDFTPALEQIAQIYVRSGSPEKAIARVNAQLARAPRSAGLHELQGNLYLALKQYQKAEASFEQIIAIDPSFVNAYLDLGKVYAETKSPGKAIERFQQAAKVAPTSPIPHMMLGIVYEREGKRVEARAAYEKALELDPQFAPAANNLAYQYAEDGGDLTKALKWATLARQAQPDNPQVADTLGWVRYKLGEYRVAIDLLRESVARLPGSAVVHYHLGMAYSKLAENMKARQELEQALRLAPDFPNAADARRVLEGLPR